jgi:hypothetical protein
MPYNPSVQYQSGAIGEGISNAGRAIGEGFRERARLNLAREQLKAEEERNRRMMEYYGGRDAADRALREREITSRAQDRTADNAYRERELAWRMKDAERTYQPPPEVVDQARKMGYLYAPQGRTGGSWLSTKKDTATPDLQEREGYYFNGKTWIQKRAGGKPMDAADAATLQTATTQLEKINNEIAEHQTKMAEGDMRFGFLNTSNRETRVNDLLAQRKGLEAKLGAMRGAAATAPAVQPSAPAAAPAPAPAAKPTPTLGIPRPAGPRPAATGNQDPAAVLQQARDAIGRGAPREKVLQRLQSMGIDATGLDAPPPEQLLNVTVR